MRFHWFHLMPDALARENTQRFAHDVMPSLRDLWSDYEDHWYPKPLKEIAKPGAAISET